MQAGDGNSSAAPITLLWGHLIEASFVEVTSKTCAPARVRYCTHSYNFFYIYFFIHMYFPASVEAVVTGVVLSPPQYCLQFFIAHRVQQSRSSSIFHPVLLAHALALSAGHFFVHNNKSPRNYTSMHSGEFELTNLTYTRLEDNLTRRRDEICDDEQ